MFPPRFSPSYFSPQHCSGKHGIISQFLNRSAGTYESAATKDMCCTENIERGKIETWFEKQSGGNKLLQRGLKVYKIQEIVWI